MNLAIMQPYFFPYLGYYQLVNYADKFIFYDDVNYIKQGWINRNRILSPHGVRYITVPVSGASSFKKIFQIEVSRDGRWRESMLANLRRTYAKAPFFDMVYPLLQGILEEGDTHISALAKRSVTRISDYLGINTEFVESSITYGNSELRGADRVLDICRAEGAIAYLNLPGGIELYTEERFLGAGIELEFIETNLRPYEQFGGAFRAGLSIIDVLMFNDISTVKLLLAKCG